MSGKIFLALTVLLFIVQLAVAENPSPTASAADSGVLLLRNGQVIEGHIVRNGDCYVVSAPDQELQIHAASVEFLCRDLRDGYQRKKAAIRADDIQDHLQLLLWCERHEMLDLARQELDAAEAIDRDHPMIAVLRRRLKIESQQTSTPARPAEKVEQPPGNEQLDQMTRGMPPGTVELFVQVVQPILLNHYPGVRGYALPDNKHLQLTRPPLGESPGRRITQRNLYAVLQCIDGNNPGESPLLKASAGSAVGAGAGSFPARYSTQYLKLAQWVYLVAQKPMPAEDNGVENTSFADLAGGAPQPGRVSSSRHIPYLPPASGRGAGGEGLPSTSGRGAGGEGLLPNSVARDKDDKDDKEIKDGRDAAPADHRSKPRAARESDETRSARRIPAERAAAQAIEDIDPYDPATFNNQANAPTQMPTPASRTLNGGGRP